MTRSSGYYVHSSKAGKRLLKLNLSTGSNKRINRSLPRRCFLST
jgi:hypothetical protein